MGNAFFSGDIIYKRKCLYTSKKGRNRPEGIRCIAGIAELVSVAVPVAIDWSCSPDIFASEN